MATGPEGSGYEPYDEGEQVYEDSLISYYESMLDEGLTPEEAQAAIDAKRLLDEALYRAVTESIFGRAGRKD